MKKPGLSARRVYRFWHIHLPERADLIDRFFRIGLLPQDFDLSPLELVCACSIMLEHKTIFEVCQSIDHLNHESTESRVDEAFFQQLDQIISEMEMSGMRARARKLRKLGQGLAAAQGKVSWRSHWENEIELKHASAIKDEPFLPQQG